MWDRNLSSQLIGIQDAVNALNNARVLLEVVRLELNDVEGDTDSAWRLLDLYEERFDRKMDELQKLIVNLRTDVDKATGRPALTLVS
jgi:cellulose biosynthesis protein BcsQ